MDTPHRIAVITMGVKLGDETKGYTRFLTLAEQLAASGFDVDLITSSFQHWEKAQRDTASIAYSRYPFRVVFIEEPGYERNIDLKRVRSHSIAAKNLRILLEANRTGTKPYDLIYCEIPPNNVARIAAEHAARENIPFVVDVNDLWPEAMRMVMDIPLVSSVLFYPLARDARSTYRLVSAVVGTSDEYAAHPFAISAPDVERVTVYVGGDKQAFDAGAQAHASQIDKPASAFWVTYAGTLGASYDLATLVTAASILKNQGFDSLRILIVGDGPDRSSLQALAEQLAAPVDFLGYRPYEEMAAWLVASDVLVNSLVRKAPQSIVNKIGDYLFAGRPMINTGSSAELRNLVVTERVGFNVVAEDTNLLAECIQRLADDPPMRISMGLAARILAEKRFDRTCSYQAITDLIDRLLKSKGE
ncbi:MAG: glycosyltransferase family 4 protein [Coriobacteriia bacterium]|nr:glycosyltransferase family 4 protein [Coriobacteriia bacterium]